MQDNMLMRPKIKIMIEVHPEEAVLIVKLHSVTVLLSLVFGKTAF